MNNKNLTYPRYFLFTLILVTLFSSHLPTASAQEPEGPTEPPPEEVSCGSIITPEETVEIADCSNPFGAMLDTNPFTLRVGGVVVGEGDLVTVSESGANAYSIETPYYMFGSDHKFFLREGMSYTLVESEPFEAVEEDYRRIAVEYFGDEVSFEPYVHREMGNFADTEDEAWDWDLYYGYSYYFNENFVPSRPPLVPGQYTLVSTEMNGYSSQNDVKPLLQKFLDFVIPTAYAQYYSAEPVYVLNFTLTVEDTEPLGASSVLFLPGMQASRLYMDEDGDENQLWEPNRKEDFRKLEMDDDGFSVNEIYTEDVIDEIALPYIGGNVYKGFLSMLEDLKDEEVIYGWDTFAYDWRYSVDDIVISGTKYKDEVRGVIDEIEVLADESYTDKVTLVAHSNGGLLAKAVMLELDSLGKVDLIDKVVFIGTPQVGTPKALGVILHGLDQAAGLGLIIDDVTAREVVRNMAGPYGLLPTDDYFSLVNESIILQDDSLSTEYLNAYNTVDSYEEMLAFLRDDNTTRLVGNSINIPGRINEQMLEKSFNLHKSLDGWRAPSEVDVFEIVGTGLATIKAFEYREFGCSQYFGGLNCLFNKYSKPYPIFTTNGDETVVADSASAYGGDKFTGYIDLFGEGEGLFNKRYDHSDLMESPTVQEYLDSIIKFGHQNDTLVIPSEFVTSKYRYKIVGVHSPVDMVIMDSFGKRAGIDGDEVYKEIFGSDAFTLGDSKYVVVPEGSYMVEIMGYATSTFSITVDVLDDEEQDPVLTLNNLPTTPKMTGTFVLEDNLSDLQIDLDGDGQIDLHVNLNTGEIREVTQSEIDVILDEATRSSSGTRITPRATPLVLGISTTGSDLVYDEAYRKLLLQLLDVINQYLVLIKKQ